MVVIGLGNPGAPYAGTPHNLGWVVLDRLAAALGGLAWQTEGQMQFAKYTTHRLLKPQAFMNTSGPALKAYCSYRKILFQPDTWWLVHDDLDLSAGELRSQVDRSSAGHQGVQSIIDAFQSQAFHRLRIGIGSNRELPEPVPAETYVLQPIRQEHRAAIERGVTEAVEFLRNQLG